MMDDAKAAGEIPLHVLQKYNDWCIFGHLGDSFADLENILKELFTNSMDF